MKSDKNRLRELIARESIPPSPDELRRERNIFFVGGNLPERETLETLFDSHCQAAAELFHLTFGDVDSFHLGETLARAIKKNFSTHLVARFDYPAPPHLFERAYTAGVDIMDIPLGVFDRGLSRERGLAMEERLRALDFARSIFPRWSVASTLVAGDEPSCSTVAGIDALLANEIVPLVAVSPRAAHYPADEIAAIFDHLAAGWRKRKVTVKPLLPLIQLSTPLVDAKPRGVLRGFIDRLHDRQLLATSELRRNLRVRQEASFESAGL